MQTTRDFATAARAEILARLVHGETTDVEAGQVPRLCEASRGLQ